ncbi:hypothetical protein PHLGIDRAFT_117120 [Phlebiopsis gigantea 11061_1 CR5-6]|uniref:Uncharacterized protein n=1 Tax=Phlebiopsis gigantea (strain 11061_1 CR5-6) TaxID=745531 RepID=A0A0C3PP14_PHLG1|nr:hypothetical protein PHLGIDRAFT_117120 [Phlebiopsis gigantea 11061_1 CR5-6]
MFASTSSKADDDTPRLTGPDDGDRPTAEKEPGAEGTVGGGCSGVKVEVEKEGHSVEGEAAAVRTVKRPAKRARECALIDACTGRPSKRCRSAEPLGPAEQESYAAKARVGGLVSNIFTLVVSLEQTTQDVIGRSGALLDLRGENTKLKTFSAEKAKQNDDLTRVLWTVRDEYYKLKSASTKAQEKSEQLSENLRMLTKDHDTLMRERNRAQAMADDSAKKSDQIQRVLWTVRGEYYKLKSNLEKAEADAKSASQRNKELSHQTKDLASRNEELSQQLKKAKEESDTLRSRASETDSVTKELLDLRAECERLRHGEQTAVVEMQTQKGLHANAQQDRAIAAFKLTQSKEISEQLRRKIQEGLDRETKLISERDRLLLDRARLGKELEKIIDERDRYRKSHEQTVAEKARLERAVVKTELERKKLTEEKEKFVLDWDRLVVQRDQTVADRDFLRVERDAMHVQTLTLIADKTRLEAALKEERDRKDALVAERDELLEYKAQVAQVSQDKTLLRMEVGRLLDREAKERIEDTLQRAKNAELYDALLKENVELRAKLMKADKSSTKAKAR